MAAEQALLRIVRSQLTGEKTDVPVGDWAALIALAQRHGMARYAALYAESLPDAEKPAPEILLPLRQLMAQEITRHVTQMTELDTICAAMAAANVDVLPFKGAVTARRYPNDLLRSMGDLDILYRTAQHDAFRAVMERLGYGEREEGRKNDTYYKKPYVCVEAHRSLVAADSPYAAYCGGAWERSVGDGCVRRMTAEDELIFHIIHLAVHLRQSGAGVRFIADVFIYESLPLDRAYVERELEKLELLAFYRNVRDLAAQWFGGGAENETASRLGNFILSGGTFGTAENAAALGVRRGRGAHLRSTFFPSYREMCSMYPWLEGKAILLPYAWVRRGVSALTRRRKNVRQVLTQLETGSGEKGRELAAFYRECGLPTE
ncbi:MAG: nucleotidyltransferase family protein [Oscillospiraceae bacterium]|nr:nucleotidyltransferase family protein [Oscillospiraceae bacterium]